MFARNTVLDPVFRLDWYNVSLVPTTTYESLRCAMHDGDVVTVVQQLLSDIVDGHLLVRALRHPLGFVCIKLLEEEERGACVHAWDGSSFTPRLTTSNIHSHSWHLLSHALYGSVWNTNFLVTDTDADTATHRVAEIHSRPSYIDEIQPTGRLVKIDARTREQYPHDQPYELAAGIFHTTGAEGYAATLALGEGRPGYCDLSLISLTDPAAEAHRTERHLFSELDTRRYAKTVLNRLVSVDKCSASPTVIEPVGM